MYHIRNANESDHNFIFSTLKSAELYSVEREVAFYLFVKTCDLYILTPENDYDLIVGTCVINDDKLVWIYVKEIYRRSGIANYMLNMCNAKDEFMLKGTNDAWKNMTKSRRLKWNPYLLFNTLNFINL